MVTYRSGSTLLHRLDPRSKLLFQLCFAVAVFASEPLLLAGLAALALGWLGVARLSPLSVARAFRYPLVLLSVTPLIAGVQLGSPWFAPEAALTATYASLRILPVFALSAAYVRTTTVRDSRAAVQWLLPGKAGTLVGVGVGLTVRLLPMLRRDLLDARAAMHARLGDQRGTRARLTVLARTGISRVGGLSDRLALALRARCFAWNPTLPELQFSGPDYAVCAAAAALAMSPLL